MVYVYAADVSQLPDPKEFPEVLKGLLEERKQKTLRCIRPDSRKQSLGAGLLLRHVLHLHGIIQEDICYGENGKPETHGICFNLSHSHDMVVCAVSEKAVGCDIEKITDARKHLAERFFCKEEILHLETFANTERDSEFFRLWTMKESYMKMTGEGMRLPLNQFELLMGNEVKVRRDGVIDSCFIKEYKIPGYRLTVCGKEAEFAEEVEYVAAEVM